MFTLLFPVKAMKSVPKGDPKGDSRAGHSADPGAEIKAPRPADHHAAIQLDRLPQGARGAVRSIGGASTPLRQRLMELGITIGSEIEVIRKAPFSGPIEISVRGYRLSLRRTEAHIVMIDRQD
jgi:ferrous iron transport protein A